MLYDMSLLCLYRALGLLDVEHRGSLVVAVCTASTVESPRIL